MKYLKYSLRLIVPLFVFLGSFILLTNINLSSSNYPVFAGTSQYLKMMLEPDILRIVLLNIIPHFLTVLYSSAVLFTLYGALREKLARINELLVYAIVWVVSFASAVFTATLSGLSYLTYPSFMVTMNPSELRSINLLYSSVLEGIFVSIAVFVVWAVFKLVLKIKSANSTPKPLKNHTTLFAIGTALMGVYVVFRFLNGLIRTLWLLGASGETTQTIRIILNANWLSVAVLVVAIVILVKTASGKHPQKGLYIAAIALSSLVLLGSLTVSNAFNTLYIASSNISLIFKVLTVVFKSISGAFIDTLASVMLIIASVRALTQENAESLPKHRITATLSKTLGITAIVAVAMVVLTVLFSVFITLADGNSGSIGIIGGADGPTAWFVISSMLESFGTYLISCLCLATASIVLKIVSSKQKAEVAE